ncbi:MAG: hypothetical protein IJN39_05875, partial [Clostridia bacterium]|nr:hypothetical protein [Clostridia bacterium]
ITGLCTVYGVINDLFSMFTGEEVISGILGTSAIYDKLFLILCPLVFIAIAVWTYIASNKKSKQFLENIQEKLNEMQETDVVDFLKNFEAEDFYIPDCNSGSKIFVCSLDSYNAVQKHILFGYQTAVSERQIWWIFAKRVKSDTEEDFILPESSNFCRRISYFDLIPLASKVKKKLATDAYKGQTKFSPESDAGLKTLGVDYIFRHSLNNRSTIDAQQEIRDKIKAFSTEHQSGGYTTDISIMIRLVAELSCNYKIDFYDKRKWQNLFDNTKGNADLNKLDEMVSYELKTDNRDFKILIPEILMSFGDCFEEVLASCTANTSMDLYEQWCIIKALKSCARCDDEKFVAINDALMNEFESAPEGCEDLKTSVWAGIIIQTADIFYKNQQFCFLPYLMHKLICIFKSGHSLTDKIFSESKVLDIARANLILNFNTASDTEAFADTDLIKDHYEIACLAVLEKNKDFNLDKSVAVPPFFDLLRLSNAERLRYYNALSCLGETAVLMYYEYLFDIYCAELNIRNENIRFCVKDVYLNSLYEKYGKNIDYKLTPSLYIILILYKLLELIESLYSDTDEINRGVYHLNNLIITPNDELDIQNALFLIARLDIVGADTLSFIACLAVRINSETGLSENIYLKLGNYLISLIFLTYHENSLSDFFNNDFMHLVTICTSYEEPSNAILGYLYYCVSISKPEHSANMILAYLKLHKEEYLQNIYDIIKDIPVNDVGAFLTIIYCSARCLTDEEISSVYVKLRDKITRDFSNSPNFTLYNELLTLHIDDHSTDAFENDSPENNTAKLLKAEDNVAYIIFSKYLAVFRNRYLELFPAVSEKILNSHMIGKWNLFIDYIKFSENTESEDYLNTCKLFYTEFKPLVDKHNSVKLIGDFKKLLILFTKRKEETPHLYEWLSEEEASGILGIAIARISKVLIILAKEYLAYRKLNNYGILLYTSSLLQDVPFVKNVEEYDSLSDDEKLDYIIANFKNLEPVEVKNYATSTPRAYTDMLDAFIKNKNDIQHKLGLSEKECLLKIAKDALLIVSSLLIEDTARENIVAMINDYILFIDKQ